MNYRYFFGLLALLAVPLFQVVSTSFLGSFFSFNCIVIALVFLLMLARPQSSIYFVVVSGLILDMHAQTEFGVFLLALAGTAVVVQALHLNFFTNRSLYSLLLLVLIATIVFHLIFIGIISLYYIMGWHASLVALGYWKLLLGNIVGNTLITFLVFGFVNRYSNSFKPTYLQS